MEKITENNCIVRTFDCKPYDDQLRAYVYEVNGLITKVEVVGE
jgi:hypothetical protein